MAPVEKLEEKGKKTAKKTKYTFTEFKETFFPNTTIEELTETKPSDIDIIIPKPSVN